MTSSSSTPGTAPGRRAGRPAIALAALSARAMAEAAVRDGFDVVALDLFGDADTRAAALDWQPIGRPGTMRIDADRTLGALRRLAADAAVDGWVAGGGFDADPDLLAAGAALLPLLGTAPADVRAVRDPAGFFGRLRAQGGVHPEIAFGAAPPEASGWLRKDAGGCGGRHIRRAGPGAAGEPAGDAGPDVSPTRYFQREAPGRPMSATFVAAGGGAVVLGFNALTVREVGGHPFVFCGAIGPVPLPAALAADFVERVRRLAAEFRLRGLASLDVLLDGDALQVLEVNPRPPASLALYADRAPMALHVDACLRGGLPAPDDAAVATPAGRVTGFEIVFARRPTTIDGAALRRLAAWPNVHDVPAAGVHASAGDPVCTLAADGIDADDVRGRLERSRDALLGELETRR